MVSSSSHTRLCNIFRAQLIPPDLTRSPTSIVDHPISETRLQNLHHYLTKTNQLTITLAETRTFIQVMREDVLATRLLLEDFRNGCRLGDDEIYGPSFHERVCAAFPGKERPSWELKCTQVHVEVMYWRAAEKARLGESCGVGDKGEVLFSYAEDGSIVGPQFGRPLRG